MIKGHLPYVIMDVDRHGNKRYYFRRKGERKVRLHGEPGSRQFREEYENAVASRGAVQKARTDISGSFGAVCKAYYASVDFKKLHKSTQAWRRRVLDEICREHGGSPIRRMEPVHVRKLRDQKSDHPAAAESRVKALRALFQFAIECGAAEKDPTKGVKLLRYHSEGHHTWTPEEIRRFQDRHPIGTKARLAMTLMLYTACRRGDVIRLGPQHVRDGRLQFRQAKNETRSPIDIDIPIHPDLQWVIDQTPSQHLTFLVTEYGKPFSVAGFGNWFREKCNEAGLTNCTAHGLRKATAAHLAECGATSNQIMAVTGHRSLTQVSGYTRKANRSKMADEAMAKFKW